MFDCYLALISCLLAGIAFAALAVWLTTRRGNTIQDILSAPQFVNANALKVEIGNKLKLATNIPIVALYLVAAVVAIGLPAYSLYVAHHHYEAWRVIGRIATRVPPKEVSVTLRPPHIPVAEDGSFDDEIPVKRDGDGNRIFPSLTFTWNPSEYDQPVVHLHREVSPRYVLRVVRHEIHIDTPIVFARRAE